MSTLYGIYHIGRSALLTHQQGISVTGHNIANVNTPGYSRQRLSLETSYPVSTQPGQLGMGVEGSAIQRVYDRFVDAQIFNENMGLGQWEAYSSSMQRLERVFDDSSGYGLSNALTEFWNAWQDLSNNPGGQPERVALIAKGESLTTTFNQLRGDLSTVQRDVDANMCLTVEEINDVTAQIAALNEKISKAEFEGQNANDFRDKRNVLLNDLSKLIDINSFEGDDGRTTVLLSSGKSLVNGNSSWNLAAEPTGAGLHDISWMDSDGNPVVVTGQITGGKLKGWIEVRDTVIVDYTNDLDTLAGTLIAEVNTLHSAGYGLTNPSTGLPYSGNDFFSGTTASDIAIQSAVSVDFRTVAASSTQAGVPGDNGNAVLIANLQSKLTMNGTPATSTFDTFYQSLIGELGSEVRSAETNYVHQTDMTSFLNRQREAFSGVSIDEEMIALVKFQRGYEASAKIITVVDEMMESILRML